MDRLAVQYRLMCAIEKPILSEFFAGRSGLNVLDVGCNNGYKTTELFSTDAVAHVIGLEYDSTAAAQANERFGDGRFAFYECDAETPDFPELLRARMRENGVDGFDIIYLSYVLSHLSDPGRLLRCLRPLLRPGGHLLAAESDDSRCMLLPGETLLREFLCMLAEDPFAGNRATGKRLPALLEEAGFGQARIRCDAIAAGPGETERKSQIFEMFFSYLPEDAAILRARRPEDDKYIRWEAWIDSHFRELERDILSESSCVSMGMMVVTCDT